MSFENDIEELLAEDERLLLVFRPKFFPYWISSFFYVPIGVFLILFVVPISVILFGSPLSSEGAFGMLQYAVFLFYIPLYFAALGTLMSPLFSAIAHHYEVYALTNMRLFVRTGLVNIETEPIWFNEISHVDVMEGWQDRVFGGETGTLSLETSQGYRALKNVDKPYEIQNMLSSTL